MALTSLIWIISYNFKLTKKLIIIMNGTHSNYSGSRMGQTAMYESEAQRLQREADSFTKKFEHEKK